MGRPAKSKNDTLTTKIIPDNNDDVLYKCTRCGEIFQIPQRKFYASAASPLFTGNMGYSHICMSCVNQLYEEYKARFGDCRRALIIICHYLDMYFSETLYEQLKESPEFSLGTYMRTLNVRQFKSKNFNNYIFELLENGEKSHSEVRSDIEKNWSAADRKNQQYVISSLGYDCFDDEEYNNNDRKMLFNMLADYLTDDVLEDQHKLQVVVRMVKTMWQVNKVDSMINSELKKVYIDYGVIDKLTASKDKLMRSINTIANDNGISAKSSGKSSKGSNTLTNIMKEMQEHGFEETKVNIVNAKLSESYLDVARQSTKALIEELNFTTDEYAKMLADQTEMVTELQDKTDKQAEEIRQLKIRIKQMNEEKNGDSS